MILHRAEYRSKVLGCWLGKNIGGTLGAPFEWKRQVNDVQFYTQDLQGEPEPNDDLDIQLLWLIALEERGIELDGQTLGEYFLLYVTPHWAEYGMAKINMRSALPPPLSGSYRNAYKHSCGAFIRSEIWACIAPGCPGVAAAYAYEDAIIDHGDGEGTFAEVFVAALESAAFVLNDVPQLLEIGLSYIPADCGVAGAVRNAIASYNAGLSWLEARDAMLEVYRGSSAAGDPANTSPRDREKGFHEGQQGWDAPSNIGMLVLGLLYGEGDFAKTLCTTVNLGEDTDCTGATVGSLYGILHGAEAIPEEWLTPVGRKIKTACLNLGELDYIGTPLPATVDELTDRTERIAQQVILRRRLPITIAENAPTDLSDLDVQTLYAPKPGTRQGRWHLMRNLGQPVYRFDFFEVAVDYGCAPIIRDGVPKTITLTVRNTYKVMEHLNVHWYLPAGWRVSPSADARLFLPNEYLGTPEASASFTLEADTVTRPSNRCVVELSIEGRPTVMTVPIILLNGNSEPRTCPAAGGEE